MCYKYYFEKFKKNIFLIKFYKIDEENNIEKENNIRRLILFITFLLLRVLLF